MAVTIGEAGGACTWSAPAEGVSLPVVFRLDFADTGETRALTEAAACAKANHLAIYVQVVPPTGWQAQADPYAALRPWISWLEGILQAHKEQIAAVILGDRPESKFEPQGFAFLVEKTGTLIRSLGSQAALVVGPLGAGAGDWMERIPPARIRPYVNGIALAEPADLVSWMPILAREFPGSPVWLQTGGQESAGFLRRYEEARKIGISTVLAPAGGGNPVLRNMIRRLPLRFVPDPSPQDVKIQNPGAPAPLGFFADPLGPERAVVLPAPPGGERWRVSIGPDPVQTLHVFDLSTGAEMTHQLVRAKRVEEPFVADLAEAAGPVLVRYVSTAAPRMEPETVSVVSGYELTADEIIARLRAFEAAQARTLQHYTAKATLSYNYRAEALNESISVSSVNKFYFKDGVGDYEETELYVNGARWRGKPPNLPFIQPEKVKEVPIEIRLDASYVYKLEGKEKAGGRPSYLLSFEPARENLALYSGQAWIDQKTFALNKIHLVRQKPEPPITSVSDVIEYGWVQGPETRHWLPVSGYRQMVFTVLGRAVAVERKVKYEDFVVNDTGFDTALQQAYGSDRPMLRDDAQGLAILRKTAAGRVRQDESLKNVAVVGGMSVNSNLSPGTPFAGINYFDFDWRGSGHQLDVAFAGPFLDAAWTNPSLGKSRWELSFEALLIGLREHFKRATSAGNQRAEDLKQLQEHVYTSLTRPLTSFSKAEFQLDMSYDDYNREKNTSSLMVEPHSAWTATTTGRWKYYRTGWLVDIWASASRRLTWADWGLPGGLQGSGSDVSYERWGMGVIKSFYPTSLQKLSFSASASSGHNLDRFSRFRVGDFRNIQVRGFNGTDLTFDRGVSFQSAYRFTLPKGGVSIDLNLDSAVIENTEDFGLRDAVDPNGMPILQRIPGDNQREYIIGMGIGTSFSGPWGTLMRISAGQSLASSLDVGSGTANFRLTVVKTFGQWPWGKGKKPERSPIPPPP